MPSIALCCLGVCVGGEGEGCWQKYIWQIINTVNLPANKYLTGGESAPQGEIRQAGMSSQPINE